MVNITEIEPPLQHVRVSKQSRLKSWLGEKIRQRIFFPALNLYTPLKIEGLENLIELRQAIFVANHSSHLDTPLLLAALPQPLRLQTRVAAASDYFFNHRWKGALVEIVLNAFPLVRKGPGRLESLLQAHALLTAGYSLLLFPEGTRTPDGQLQAFKPGVGRLATRCTVPVVPVWIDGTYESMPKGTRWPKRYPVTVTFGKPLWFALGSDPQRITGEVERQVRNLRVSSSELQASI
jgi:long-chain acyl-CoA synthetase